jgi:hypothetical protein
MKNFNYFMKVWAWEDAPEEYKSLSEHGGDEDYVAFVPKELVTDAERLFYSGSSFGSCDVESYQLPNYDWVYIGAHS